MKIVHVFLEADLRNGHRGLAEQCAKSKIDIDTLYNGECVLFFNRKLNKVKAYCPNGYMGYAQLDGRATWDKLDVLTQAVAPNMSNSYTKKVRDQIRAAIGSHLSVVARRA